MTSYTRALQLKQQTLRNVDSDGLLASVATSINNIGYLRQRSGASPEESMAAYRDSLKIKKEILGESHLSVGKTLNNIGSVYYSARDFEHALQAYHEAKDILERNLGATHGDVATVHSNIGDVYMAMGEGQKAHDQYKEALNIRWMRFHEHDPKVIRLLEKIAALEMDQWYVCDNYKGEDHETRVFEEEEEEIPEEFHNLSCEVQEDIKEISDLERKMALDMIKDKLRIRKGMRNLDIENDADEIAAPRACATPLSQSERSEALSSVKERLAKLRERRAMEESTNQKDDTEHNYSSLKLNLGDMLDK
jgi:tetratricopeptide (TPR) repeat protein